MQNLTLKRNPDSGKEPLYFQIYQAIIEEIRNGNLKTGEKLPSKKQLCNHLGLSQTTVENAYEMLMTEGYIRSVPRSGYYVLDDILLHKSLPKAPLYEEKKQPAPSAIRYSLASSTVDVSGFPFTTWAKISKEVMYNSPELLSAGESQGDLILRNTLNRYLHEFRGVNADSSCIIIGAGTEYLLGLLSRILSDYSVFAIENPCYMRVYHNLRDNGKILLPIQVTQDGIRLNELESSDANIVYITPSHQYPTGVTMPIGARLKLLQWAAGKEERYIIEDDYDSEYRFSGKPIPSLQSLDHNGKVIYLGTFSRSIAPSIRIAYMILPQKLMEIYRNHFGYCAPTVSRFEQHTLEKFLSGGHYTRNLNRTRTLYKRRKEDWIHLMKKHFNHALYEIHGDHLGLHFLLTVKNGMTEAQLKKESTKSGLLIRSLSEYYIEGAPEKPVFLINYSGFSYEQAEEIVLLLKKAWNL